MSEDLSYAEATALRLVVQGTEEEFPLAEDAVTIGSGADNTIVLTDPEVAELHATIRQSDEGEGYLIEDAGSLAGTYVNEQRVEGSLPLQEGDVIRLGNTLVELQGGGEAALEAEPVLPEETGEVPVPPPPREKTTTSPWLIGGIAAAAVILCLACFAVFSLSFLGNGDRDEAPSQPPVAAATATRAPARPTDTPQPDATATTAPTDVVPPPQVEYFQANPSSIYEGNCTTLQWGAVEGAEEVKIDPRIGGVGTPDSIEVCPGETTEYVLTATGPGGITEASVTVEVVPGLADLMVESITFDPNPANAQQPCEVAITMRNIGSAAAGRFDWQWQAGFDAAFDGTVRGLDAGETTVVTVQWTPQDGYENLSTEAVVDPANQVPEDDKGNNRLQADVRVIPMPAQPETVELKSQMSLDGFRVNNGQGSTSQEILVGNGEVIQPAGELIARGFLSFDISGIPAGATIDNVELRFYQSKVTGDPYDKLVGLVLEQVSYGSSLDDRAYSAPARGSLPVSPLPSAGQWYMLDEPTLVSWVQSDVAAGQSQFQVRLRFSVETDSDGLEDWISIQPGGSALGSSKAPVLVITYVP
jgi:hypothetical protein